MLTSRRVTVLLLRNFRLHIRPRGCDGRAMPVGLIATTVRLIPSIRATSATRPARRDGREDRRYGSMPPRRFVTNFLPTPVGNLRRPEHPEDELLILNYHLPAVTPHLLRHTRRCFCADGGANRLYDELPAMLPRLDPKDVRAAHIPECIVGDLDSVRPEVLRFYVDAGARAVDLSHDQDTTDLHKALTAMVARVEPEPEPEPEPERDADADAKAAARRILVVGALGGRFDHEMSNLSAMHEFAETRIVLLGRSSMATLVPPGITEIVPDLSAEGPSCGLVPMQGPASVKTAGLRWDLDGGRQLRFGEFISTSNQLQQEGGGVVRVETDRSLVWTTDVTDVRMWTRAKGVA